MGFLCDQGTETAEESGENEARKEDKEDEDNLAESQEKNVSAGFSHRGFLRLRSVHPTFMELLPAARSLPGHSVRMKGGSQEFSQGGRGSFSSNVLTAGLEVGAELKGSPRKDLNPGLERQSRQDFSSLSLCC